MSDQEVVLRIQGGVLLGGHVRTRRSVTLPSGQTVPDDTIDPIQGQAQPVGGLTLDQVLGPVHASAIAGVNALHARERHLQATIDRLTAERDTAIRAIDLLTLERDELQQRLAQQQANAAPRRQGGAA